MAWTAKIKPIQAAPIYSDTINLDVEFTEGDRSFTKQYNLHTQHFKEIKAVEDLIERELQNLTKFDKVVERIQTRIDKKIDMKASKADVLDGVAEEPVVDNTVIRG